MSATDNKWELGVVAFYEEFEDFDRPSRFKTAYAGLDHDKNASASSTVTLTLEDSIASDYTGDPFYLTGDLTKPVGGGTSIVGSEVTLGPSSDSSYDGSIERVTVASISSNQITLKRESGHTHIILPYAKYAANDPVMIRTVPKGWTAPSAFSSRNYGVSPIGRYHERDNLALLDGTISPGFRTGLPSVTNYAYQRGVRLYSHTTTTDTNRYIQTFSKVNSFRAFIRRWRASWFYRTVRADVNVVENPTNFTARVYLGVATADNDPLYLITYTPTSTAEDGQASGLTTLTGYTGSRVANAVKTYNTSQTTWTQDTAIFSGLGGSDSGNAWSMGGTANDPKGLAFNRGSKFFIRLALEAGENTAFEVDDLIIEHAHGTSQEDSGYYEIDDWPDPGSLSWNKIEGDHSSRLHNNQLKLTQLSQRRPKYTFSVDFVNVTTTTYRDMEVLEEWSKRGFLIALRPFSTLLPNVMVGKMRLSRRDTRHWDLGRASFTLSFEEA